MKLKMFEVNNKMLEVKIIKQLLGFTLDVEFSASGGNSALALLGASGCGKSITLQCIAGLTRPDKGRITLNGRVLFDSDTGVNLSPQKRKIGYLFQNYSLFPNMTALQNIMCAIPVTDVPKRKRAEKYITTMHLEGEKYKKPHQMSGGQQQRCALARMLAAQPEAILLDEPFSALDNYLRWHLEFEISDVIREFGGPCVYVSHSRGEVFRLCTDICVLNNGKSEYQRSAEDLFSKPETLSACLITGCKNFSRAEILQNGRIYAADWGVEFFVDFVDFADFAAAFDTTYIAVQAHHIRAGKAKKNSFTCRVSRVIEDLFSIIVILETPGDAPLRMEMAKEEWGLLGEPKTLQVHINTKDLMPIKG